MVDLIGKTFGHLTVLECDGRTDRGQALWKCKCSCGNEKTVRGYHLTGKKIRSCGCLKRETVNIKWPQSGKIARWLWNRFRISAIRRGIEFNLTVEQMWQLAVAQNERCALSNQPLVFDLNIKGKHNASLDRIDSSKGYVIGNVQWVTKDINLAKRDFPQDHFIDLCRMVAKNF